MQPQYQLKQRCSSAHNENIHFMQSLNSAQIQVNDTHCFQKTTKTKIFDRANIIPTSFKQYPIQTTIIPKDQQQKLTNQQLNCLEFVQDESFSLSRCQITQGDVKQSQVSEFGGLDQTVEIERNGFQHSIISLTSVQTQTEEINPDQKLVSYLEALENEIKIKDDLIQQYEKRLLQQTSEIVNNQNKKSQEEMEFSFVSSSNQQQPEKFTPNQTKYKTHEPVFEQQSQLNFFECVANDNLYMMKPNFQTNQQINVIPKSNKEYFSQTTYY